MNFCVFSDVFEGSAYANDDLRPKVWYENDRKNMENLLKHKLEKMLIFDQKILEVANRSFVMWINNEKIIIDSKIGDFQYSPIVIMTINSPEITLLS